MTAKTIAQRTLLVAGLGFTVWVQVWLVPAAVRTSTVTFPEVAPYGAVAVAWAVVLVACVQTLLLMTWRMSAVGRTDARFAWLRAMIAVLLVFAMLSCSAVIVLGELGFATPGLALLLTAATVAGLGGAGGVVAYLATSGASGATAEGEANPARSRTRHVRDAA